MTAHALAADPVLARRDDLLHAEALRARVSGMLGIEAESCDRVRTTYHPGRSLRVLLRVGSAAGPKTVAARMFAPGESLPPFERMRAAAGGSVLHDEELATVFALFPFDRKLPALPRLVDGSWPPLPRTARASFRIVAHAPEKAATAAAVDAEGDTVAFVKVYGDGRAARTVDVHRSLRRRRLRIPAVLAHWPQLQAVAFEALPGTRLDAAADARGLRAFGAALARLHRLAPPDDVLFTRLAPARLAAAAAAIAALRPDVAPSARALELALRRASSDRSGPIVCLHGDVHPKNVLVARDGAGLIDLDDVAGGQPAADLGSALAGLRYDALVGRADTASAEALLEGYGGVADLPNLHALRWYTAAALLGERALRAITRMRPAGLERLDAILAAGLEELG